MPQSRLKRLAAQLARSDSFDPSRAGSVALDTTWAERFATCWSVPLVSNDLVAGVIQFGFNRPYEWLPREEELLTGEIDPTAARVTHVRRRPGEHEWDTIGDRRPGLYERLLRPGMDRQHPPTAAHYSGDVE